jgi:ABC-2 type transport system permease protein
MNLRESGERVIELLRKEFRQTFRDPRMRRVVFVAPLIQLILFGYAVSTDVRNTSLFVVDQDRTQSSRALIESLTASDYFRLVGSSERPAEMVSALDHGRAVAAVVIPPEFDRDLRSGRGARVQLLLDGTNSNVATVARSQAERIVQAFGLSRLEVQIRPPIELRDRAWFNPDLESRNYNVPAVAGLIIFLICLMLTALAIVREREVGTLEQLMVSPMQPAELIAGKCIPFAIIGMVDLVIVTTVALLWFDVPFAGSFLLLLFASVLYLLSGLGLGLFISTISRTQQEAFMGMYLLFLPVVLLSGFMFPVSSMPQFFQWVTIANPVRHYLEIVRGIFLKGAGFGALWTQHLALALIGFTVLAFAVNRFQKRIG